MSRNSDLIASIVQYAIQNMNSAVDVLNEQLDDFDDADDFYTEVLQHSSVELDDFVLDMATSSQYIEDTVEILIEKGYILVEDSQHQTNSVNDLVESLVNCVGKKRAIELIIDL